MGDDWHNSLRQAEYPSWAAESLLAAPRTCGRSESNLALLIGSRFTVLHYGLGGGDIAAISGGFNPSAKDRPDSGLHGHYEPFLWRFVLAMLPLALWHGRAARLWAANQLGLDPLGFPGY